MVKACSTVLERILACVMYFIVTAIITSDYMSLKKMELAEDISATFVKRVCSTGKITLNDYDLFSTSLAQLGTHDVRMTYTIYAKEPYYGFYNEEEIELFFKERNSRGGKDTTSSRPLVNVVNIDDLSLQAESNTHIMERFLNGNITAILPQDEYFFPFVYAPALPTQEVYVGEQLVTMLITEANGITYYKEADVLYATQSGDYQVEITAGGEGTGAFINVKAWDKTITCDKGHNFPCTKQVIDEIKNSEQIKFCPYCEMYIENFIITPNNITIPIGTDDSDVPVTITAKYMDGNTEHIPFNMTDHDYNKDYAGEQTVKFSYGGVESSFIIYTAIPNCPNCGEVILNRSLFDCKMYSLCNKCLQSVPIYMGHCMTNSYTKTNEEIKNIIMEDDVFLMSRGGHLTVETIQKEKQKKSVFNPVGRQSGYFITGETVKANGN